LNMLQYLTMEDISDWVQDMEPYVQNSVKYLIGNKSDLEPIRAVTRQQGEQLGKEIGYKFMEASALNGANVNEVFQHLLTEVLKNMNILKHSREDLSNSSSSSSTVVIQSASQYNKGKDENQEEGGRCAC